MCLGLPILQDPSDPARGGFIGLAKLQVPNFGVGFFLFPLFATEKHDDMVVVSIFLKLHPENWGRFPILSYFDLYFSNGLKPPTR